ncbi:MAG: hypothetical protein PHU85_18060 [Phycisphaerae bacterium]|nr:hypothetical protein [Phycisphaerae bacterium]
MIILKCSKCKEQLEVDNGFAGGVCRCVHCGALSQVPLQATVLDAKGRPTAPPPMAKPVIAVVEAELTIAPTRRSTLSQKRQGTLAIILLAVAVLLAGGIALLAMKHFRARGNEPDGGKPVGTTHEASPIVDVKGPALVGMAITGKSVGYLLNVGSSMSGVLDYAEVGIRESVKRLDKTEFVVLPWRAGEMDEKAQPAFPKTGLAAGGGKAAELAEWFNTAPLADARDPELAAREAAKRGAATLVLVTRNDLDAADVDRLLGKVQGVTWMAMAIGHETSKTDDYPQLVRLAGGDKKAVTVVSESDLKAYLDNAGN